MTRTDLSTRTGQAGGISPALLIALVACVFMVCAAVVLGIYMLRSDTGAGAAQASEAAAAKPAPEPVFVKINPFTVNLLGNRDRMLHVELSLRVPGENKADRIKARMPQVRDRILLTLTDVDADTVINGDGKRQLAEHLRERLSKPFAEKDEPLEIEQVLFTNFIVQ